MIGSIPVAARPIVSEPTSVATGVNYTIPASANYIVSVTPTVDDVVITVSSGRSHRILNMGTKRLIVDSVLFPDVTVLSGQSADVMWDSVSNLHLVWLYGSSGGSSVSIYATMTQTAHGLTLVGQAICGHQAYNDANPAMVQTGVIASVTTNTITYAKVGDTIVIPNAVMMAGYSIATHGRFMYWRHSVLKWHHEHEYGVTDPSVSPGIMINGASGSDWDATVLPSGVLP
jgi:hypothetical protein